MAAEVAAQEGGNGVGPPVESRALRALLRQIHARRGPPAFRRFQRPAGYIRAEPSDENGPTAQSGTVAGAADVTLTPPSARWDGRRTSSSTTSLPRRPMEHSAWSQWSRPPGPAGVHVLGGAGDACIVARRNGIARRCGHRRDHLNASMPACQHRSGGARYREGASIRCSDGARRARFRGVGRVGDPGPGCARRAPVPARQRAACWRHPGCRGVKPVRMSVVSRRCPWSPGSILALSWRIQVHDLAPSWKRLNIAHAWWCHLESVPSAASAGFRFSEPTPRERLGGFWARGSAPASWATTGGGAAAPICGAGCSPEQRSSWA